MDVTSMCYTGRVQCFLTREGILIIPSPSKIDYPMALEWREDHLKPLHETRVGIPLALTAAKARWRIAMVMGCGANEIRSQLD